MRAFRNLAIALVLGLGLAAPSTAQFGSNTYERQYGRPVDVELDSLIQMPESYENRAVRTRGRLDMLPGLNQRNWALGELGGHVLIVPVPDLRNHFEREARTWGGREIEISGVVEAGTDPMNSNPMTVITFWSFEGPTERQEVRPPSPEATLEELLTRQGERDGERIRVVGQFRGSNLFGDLPSFSRWKRGDWVLKNDVFAVWVTGEKPKGKGWKLDPKLRRDSGKWLVVEGKARTVEGVVYILADNVKLTTAPSPTAHVEKAKLLPPLPLKTPVIVFSLPLDGERDIPQDTVFRVQFCNDMEETSFEGRVGLRYAGRPRPGDRVLDAVSISYDIGRRALTVDPGDLLRSGRAVELILLPGIIDIDGQSLEARPDHNPGGAADVLRFQVSGTLLTGS
jgi:hypothetical protein